MSGGKGPAAQVASTVIGEHGDIEVRVLGPLEVRVGDRVVPIGSRLQAALIADLALHAPDVVSRDRLVEDLWAGDVPATAAKALQVHVSQLRKALGPGASALVTRAPGYALQIDAERIDARRFERLLDEGRLHESLALWRGPPFGDLAAEEFVRGEALRLEALHADAVEARIEGDLAGGVTGLSGELEALVRAAPLRERLRELLMLALYREGRQADALTAYQDARTKLVDELGIEPGPGLRRLQDAILRQEPALDAATAETRAGEVFVGREQEMEQLVAALDEAVAGRGSLCLIAGEPGAGKSRLAERAAEEGRARGMLTLAGRCWEAGGAPAYWPWVEALRDYLARVDEATAERLLAADRAEIARLLPELGAEAADEGVDPDQARFRLFDAVSRFLVSAAREQPVVLVLEDMHAADPSSLQLLELLALRLRGSRIATVVNYRDNEVPPRSAAAATVTDLARAPGTRRLRLAGLAQDEVALYLELTAGMSDPGSSARLIHAETDGNPLFVSEMVRLLVSEGRLDAAATATSWDFGLPDELRDVIGRRLQRLPPEAQRVLGSASVMGRTFPLDIVEAVSAMGSADVRDALDAASDARILSPSSPDGHGRFAHAVIRDVAYAELAGAERRRLHAAAGEALELARAGELEEHSAEIAHHFASAGERPAKAVAYARMAGDRAARLLAFEEAKRLYWLALNSLPPGSDDELRADVLLDLADVEARSGDEAAARARYLDAATIARREGMADALARAALGFGGRFIWGRSPTDTNLMPLLEDALAARAGRDDPIRVRLLARLGASLRLGGGRPRSRAGTSREEALAYVDEAVALARRIGDPAALAYALEGHLTVAWAPWRCEETAREASETVAIAEAMGDRERAFGGLDNYVPPQWQLGNIEAVRGAMARMEQLVEELGQPAQRWMLTVDKATLALSEGKLDEAEELIELSFEAGRRTQTWNSVVSHELHLVVLRRAQARVGECIPTLETVAREYPDYVALRCALAAVHLEGGSRQRAQEIVDGFAGSGFALAEDETWMFAMSFLAEAAAGLGDRDASGAIYDLLIPYESHVAMGPPDGCNGAVARHLGLLAACLGRDDDAVAHLRQGIELDERMGARLFAEAGEQALARLGAGPTSKSAEHLRELQ